jgi:two-component system nitrogen regulation response regulator GlnG
MLTPEDFGFLDTDGGGSSEQPGFEEALLEEIRRALDDPDTKDLYRGLLERVERPLLELVLTRTDGNQIRAAAILGINRNTLRKKITDLKIELPARNHP